MKTPPIALLALGLLVLPVAAAERDFTRLGKDLTPIGAERAGNADGTIPAWEGGLTQPPAGWTPQQGYVDPFPDDKPLFTITAQNAAQYAARLTPGMLAMLKKYPWCRAQTTAPRGLSAEERISSQPLGVLSFT
jgi:hypothetical protein